MEEENLELNCSHCHQEMMHDQKFCVNCGFPENGTEKEKSIFHANRVLENSKKQEAPKKIKHARNGLFIISGLTILYGIVIFFQNDDFATIIASFVLALIYLLLGFWSQKKPLIAIVLGLLVYITTITLAALVDPSSLFKGIIFKVIIIVYLAKGINSALDLRRSNQL